MTKLIGKHPFVILRVKLPKNKWTQFTCLIDTGFSGGIALPQKFQDYFPSNTFIKANFILADGNGLTVESTFTSVEYKGKRKEVSVVFIGDSDSLVGVEFLDKMKFCLDLKKNKVELDF